MRKINLSILDIKDKVAKLRILLVNDLGEAGYSQGKAFSFSDNPIFNFKTVMHKEEKDSEIIPPSNNNQIFYIKKLYFFPLLPLIQ